MCSAYVKDDLSFNRCEAGAIMLSFYTALRSSGYRNSKGLNLLYIQVAAFHCVAALSLPRKRNSSFYVEACAQMEDIIQCLIPFHAMTDSNAKRVTKLYEKKVMSLVACGLLFPLWMLGKPSIEWCLGWCQVLSYVIHILLCTEFFSGYGQDS